MKNNLTEHGKAATEEIEAQKVKIKQCSVAVVISAIVILGSIVWLLLVPKTWDCSGGGCSIIYVIRFLAPVVILAFAALIALITSLIVGISTMARLKAIKKRADVKQSFRKLTAKEIENQEHKAVLSFVMAIVGVIIFVSSWIFTGSFHGYWFFLSIFFPSVGFVFIIISATVFVEAISMKPRLKKEK